MLYMVIETFKSGSIGEVYRRAAERGRMLPQGLAYLESWVSIDFSVCFQLMRTEDNGLLEEWMKEWRDLVDFEVIPVRTSAEAFHLMSRGD